MRSTRCLALIAVLSTTFAGGAAEGSSSENRAAQDVASLERAWSEAYIRHDLEAVSRIIADDYIGIDGRGVVTDKAAELEEAKPPAADATGPVLLHEQLSDLRVRVYGGTAVLTAINTARFESSGTESTIRYRRTTVWVRRGGRWQCVSFHGSRILEPPQPESGG